jgi:hypothetical protein
MPRLLNQSQPRRAVMSQFGAIAAPGRTISGGWAGGQETHRDSIQRSGFNGLDSTAGPVQDPIERLFDRTPVLISSTNHRQNQDTFEHLFESVAVAPYG